MYTEVDFYQHYHDTCLSRLHFLFLSMSGCEDWQLVVTEVMAYKVCWFPLV